MVRSSMCDSEPSPPASPVRYYTGISQDLSASQELPKARIILVGDSGTGKTSLVKKLATGVFEPMCSPTIGIDYHMQVLRYPGAGGPASLAVDIWDPAGQERFRAISSSYFKNISGVLLLFDLSNPKTFRNVDTWIEYIYENTTEDSFVLRLVGNKSDLERQVSAEEVSQFCATKQLSYAETSSTDTELTNQLFHRMGEEIIKKGYYRGSPGSSPARRNTLTLSNQETPSRAPALCCASQRHAPNQ